MHYVIILSRHLLLEIGQTEIYTPSCIHNVHYPAFQKTDTIIRRKRFARNITAAQNTGKEEYWRCCPKHLAAAATCAEQ